MRLLTDGRIRHQPVVHEGRLIGIVSIGDVVKNRIDELECDQAATSHYITGDRAFPGPAETFPVPRTRMRSS